MKAVLRGVGVALLCAGLLGGSPAQAGPELRTAKAKAAELRKQVADLERQTALAIANYDTVYAALGTVVTSRMQAEAELAAANAQLRDDAGRADGRVRALYMSGGQVALYASLLDSRDLHDAFARYVNITHIVSDDRDAVGEAEAAVHAAARAEVAIKTAASRQAKLEFQAAEQADRVQDLLARTHQLLAGAEADVRRIVEEERRAAAAAAAAAFRAAAAASAGGPTLDPTKKYACPVGSVRSFVDTWGAPRSGGRRHQGTDVFAPLGSPAYAVADGVISRWSNNALGGTTLYLRSDAGDEYYYAHNARNIAAEGTRVKAGDVIALVGKTGNAATTPPHVHFEVHPGGGSPVNPYPFLKSVCG